MSIEIQTTDGFVTLDHASFAKTLEAIKALPSRKRSYNRLVKFWVVDMTQSAFLSYAESAGVWDSKLASEVEAFAGELTLDQWLSEFKQIAGLSDEFMEANKNELKTGWENGWFPEDAIEILKEAGLF